MPVRSLNLELQWQRPQTSNSPTIWSTFSANRKNSDKIEEFRIQDLPESRYDEAIDFLTKHYIANEPLSQAFGLANDSQAIIDFQSIWRLEFTQQLATVCFKNGSDEIIALNSTFIQHKDDDFLMELCHTFKSRNMLDYFEVFRIFGENFNIFELYGVDTVLTCDGLAVNPNYSGLGICEQLFKSRNAMCKEFGVELITSEITSDYSHRATEKLGYKTDKKLRYDDFRPLYPHVRLPYINHEALRLKTKHVYIA